MNENDKGNIKDYIWAILVISLIAVIIFGGIFGGNAIWRYEYIENAKTEFKAEQIKKGLPVSLPAEAK